MGCWDEVRGRSERTSKSLYPISPVGEIAKNSKAIIGYRCARKSR